MDRVAAVAFPYPTVVQGVRRDGSLVPLHDKCHTCMDRICERAEPSDRAEVCHNGLSFRNILGSALVLGVAVHDDPTTTDAQRRAVRSAGAKAVSRLDLQHAGDALARILDEVDQEVEVQLDVQLDAIRSTDSYLPELVGRLAPQIEQALGQFHDYRALAGRTLRNISLHLEKTEPGKTLHDQLDSSTHELVAAYWSVVLMIDKLDTALFLLRPHEITARVGAPFRFHGLATKYAKIYQRDFDSKDVKHQQHGTSYGFVEANSLAVSVFPLTLLDNALKYAPSGSTVYTEFVDPTSAFATPLSLWGRRSSRRRGSGSSNPSSAPRRPRRLRPKAWVSDLPSVASLPLDWAHESRSIKKTHRPRVATSERSSPSIFLVTANSTTSIGAAGIRLHIVGDPRSYRSATHGQVVAHRTSARSE